jgi:Zn-dependent oligopeptidase
MSSVGNPLLEDWSVLDPEFALPPFPLIKPEHFKPAFTSAFASHLADLQAIVDNPSVDFDNVMAAYDRAGHDQEKISLVFSNLTRSLSLPPTLSLSLSPPPLPFTPFLPPPPPFFPPYFHILPSFPPSHVLPFFRSSSSLNVPALQAVQTEMAPLLAAHESKVYTLPGLFEKIKTVHADR